MTGGREHSVNNIHTGKHDRKVTTGGGRQTKIHEQRTTNTSVNKYLLSKLINTTTGRLTFSQEMFKSSTNRNA